MTLLPMTNDKTQIAQMPRDERLLLGFDLYDCGVVFAFGLNVPSLLKLSTSPPRSLASASWARAACTAKHNSRKAVYPPSIQRTAIHQILVDDINNSTHLLLLSEEAAKIPANPDSPPGAVKCYKEMIDALARTFKSMTTISTTGSTSYFDSTSNP